MRGSLNPALALALAGPLAVTAQLPIDTVDFEDGTFFDLSDVTTYCGLSHITSTSNTAAPGSYVAAVVPWDDYTYCPGGSVGANFGLMIPMNGVVPGGAYQVSFWWRMTEPNWMFLATRYGYPATGQLPSDPADLSFLGGQSGEAYQSPVAWRQYSWDIEIPAALPWPSDVYMQVGYMPDTVAQGQLELDDFIISVDAITGIPTNQSVPPFVVDANSGYIIFNEGISFGQWEVSDMAGRVIHRSSTSPSPHAIDISGYQVGVYILRWRGVNGDSHVKHFVKQ